MRERPTPRFHPGIERLEAKRPLAAGAATAPAASLAADPPALITPPPTQAAPMARDGGGTVRALARQPHFGYLVYRLTNPTPATNTLKPPFGHVIVQARQPVPGQTYNILMLSLKNATKQTFDASSGFQVRLPYTRFFPILKGNEQWKPGQDYIFYVLTKQYYPLPSQGSSGFQFKLGGAISTAIPGPSGIYLRIKYEPSTINKILDYAATRGPGAQGGAGIRTGIADTAIYAFASAKQKRNDFGGYF